VFHVLASLLLVVVHGLPALLWIGIGIGITVWMRSSTLRKAVRLPQQLRQGAEVEGQNPEVMEAALQQAKRRLWLLYVQHLSILPLLVWGLTMGTAFHAIHLAALVQVPHVFMISPAVVLLMAVASWPVIVMAFASNWLSYRVACQLGQLHCTRSQFLTFTVLPWVGNVVWFSSVFISLMAFAKVAMFWVMADASSQTTFFGGPGELAFLANPPLYQVGASVGLLTFGWLVNKGLRWWAMRALQGHPQALLGGELRDRTFQLAKQAGVQLRQLYVLPTPFIAMANAFALPGNRILVTDQLLNQLSKSEVDAVMAHELGHLRYRHNHILMIQVGSIVGLVIIIHFGIFNAPLHLLAIGALLLILFLSRNVRHRIEYSADRHAAQLTKDPGAMIRSLVRIMQFNPFTAPDKSLQQSFSTHPSLQKRAEALAAQHQFPMKNVSEVLAQAAIPVPESDRYALPQELQNAQRFWSSTEKTFLRTMQQWSWVAVLTLPSVCAVWVSNALSWILVSHAMPWAWTQSLIVPLALLATGAACFIASDRIPLLGFRTVRARLAQQWTQAGYAQQVRHGQFVVLSPDASPHLYDQLWFWDVGFLAPWGDRLYYLGAQTQFCLTRNQIVDLRLGAATPNGRQTPALSLRWHCPEHRASGTFRIELCDLPSLRVSGVATRQWKAQLGDWQQRSDAETRLEESEQPSLETPTPVNLTCAPLSQRMAGEHLTHLLVLVWLVNWILFNIIPISFTNSVLLSLISTIGAIIVLLPEWRGTLRRESTEPHLALKH
jgi:Zn-dependent protease with chaperone function